MNAIAAPSRQEPLVLVFASDDYYAMLLAVALHSALVHLEHGCEVYLYIIDGGIDEANKERLYRVADVDHIDVHLEWIVPDTEPLAGLDVYGRHMTVTGYFDLLIPDIVSKRFEKAIYLDCDVQVEADLRRLWQEDIGDHALLAVRSFVTPYVSSPGGLPNYQDLGFGPETPYFNAGVLVVNLKRWRAERITQAVIQSLRTSDQYRHQLYDQYGISLVDQYGLNAVLAGDWGMLDPKWNVMSTIMNRRSWEAPDSKDHIRASKEELLADAYIYHFTGLKPWQLCCEHPAKVRWRRYLEESGWFGPREKVRPATSDMPRSRSITGVSVMPTSKVTIAIPTYNRSQFLKACLESVLAQDYSDYQVVVVDNASTDDTERVVQSFAGQRVSYMRNEANHGLFGNWNRVLELNSSPYLSILPDDDVILPGFIRESVAALDKHPRAAFSAGLARYIDADGVTLSLQDPEDMPDGLVDGLEYLHRLLDGSAWTTHPATVMMRSSTIAAVGPFRAPHSKQLLDLNLYIRLAARFEVVLICKELAQVRLHPEQIKEQEFRAIEGTRPMAMMAELMDAIGYLLQSERAGDASYREWLAERLLSLNRRRGDLTRLLVPSLNFAWTDKLVIAEREILTVIPPGDKFILVDENLWEPGSFVQRHALPFLERDGQYWGAPPDDETAIQELERMRQAGVNFIVFGWPAFWWFDYYAEFSRFLRSESRCRLENERLVVFDLR